MIQRNFNLHLHAGHKVPLVINANQYDSGEQWIFTLYNGAVQYTPSSGAIVGIKSDRLGIINSGTVDSAGRVVINETQQMTAAVGKNVFELLIDDQTHGTANFIVLVEPKPGDNADFSASDLSLLQQAINGTSATAIAGAVTDWMDENLSSPTNPVVDSSLTVTGAAADAKKTGDEISELKSALDAVENGIDSVVEDYFGNKIYFPNYIGMAFPASGTNYSVINISSPVTSSTWNSIIITCTEGDSFYVTAVGGTTTYAWAFIDANGNILSRSAENANVNGSKVTAPANSTYLVVNDKGDVLKVYAENPIDVSTLGTAVNTLADSVKMRESNVSFYPSGGVDITFSDYSVNPPWIDVGTTDYVIRLNGKTYTISPTDIITIATSLSGVTVSGTVLTGSSFMIYFDINEECVKVAETVTTNANVLIQSQNPILFYAHYKSIRYGLVVDYMNVKRIEKLENEISSNTEDIASVKATISDDVIPAYFNTNLSVKIPEIISNMNDCGANGTSFVFITDLHWESNYKKSPALVKELLNKTSLKNVFCGGDIIDQGEIDAMSADFLDCINHYRFVGNNGFFPIARGNHDDNSNWSSSADINTYSFDNNTMYNLLYSHIAEYVTRIGNYWSFYFDQTVVKTRYIFADTRRNGLIIDVDEIISCMNSVPSDWHIIFIMHFALINNTTLFAGCELLANLIKAYNNRQSGNYTNAYQTATYDFTNAVGTVDLIIGGHMHADYAMTADDANNPSGIPVIATDTDSYRDHSGTEGTVNSQCFDVVTVNYSAKTVKCVRIGRGSDRAFTY